MEDDMVPTDVASLEEELEQHNDQIGLLMLHSQSLSEEREEMSHQYDEQKKQQGVEGIKSKEILDKMEQIKVQCICQLIISLCMCYRYDICFRVK